MNNEKMHDIGTAVIIIIFSLFVLLALGAYFYRRELAYVFYEMAKFDAYAAYLLNKATHGLILSRAPLLYEALSSAKYLKPDPMSLDVLVLVGNRWVPAVSLTFQYLKWFNAVLLAAFFYFPTYVLLKKLSLMRHAVAKPIKVKHTENPRVPLYGDKFDRLLKAPERPTGDGPEGKEFRKYDYFPPEPFFAEDEYEEYVSFSVYYSTHPLNKEEKRFEEMKTCWEDLLRRIAEMDENGNPGNFVGYYALMRFRFMDRMRTSALWNRKERKIFVGEWNEKTKGVPIAGLFTENNAFESIKRYIRKYRPDSGEDFTDVFLEELDVFLEILNFRFSRFAKRTAFYDGKLPSHSDFPLFVPAYGKEKETPEHTANERFVKEIFADLPKLLYIPPSKGRFMQPLLPRNYILSPLRRKDRFVPSDFTVPGIKIPVEIIFENVVKGYIETQKKAAAELKSEIETLEKSGVGTPEEIMAKKALLRDVLSKINVADGETRLARIRDIFETHDFQETVLISLWKYSMKLQNMPTGRLVNMKYDNVVLWYALCNLGGVFYYKPGMPISTMVEMETEKRERMKRLEEKYDSEEISGIRDIAGEEIVEEAAKEKF